MSNVVFKENRSLSKNFLSKTPNMEHSPGVFTIQREYATYKIDESFPYHYHDWYELYYLHPGQGVFRLGIREYTMKDGVWLFAPQGMNHKMIYTSDSHERTLIYFSKEYISPSIFPHLRKLSNNPVYVTNTQNSEELYSLMGKLQSEFDNPDEFSPKLYKNMLFEILVCLIRNLSSVPDTETESDLIITHVIDYINSNFAKRVCLEDLAELNSISVSHLSKKFKLITGMNFSYYLNLVRTENAKKLLLETDDSISLISEKCGFNDSNYFSYVFKNTEGISPIKYRKMKP